MKNLDDKLIKEFENVRAVHCAALGWLTPDPNLDQGRHFTCSIDHSRDTLEGKMVYNHVLNVDGFDVQHFVSMGYDRDGMMAVFNEDNRPICKFMQFEYEERDEEGDLLDFGVNFVLTCSKTGRWGDIEKTDD